MSHCHLCHISHVAAGIPFDVSLSLSFSKDDDDESSWLIECHAESSISSESKKALKAQICEEKSSVRT